MSSFTTIDTATAALDEALYVPVTFQGIDDHLLPGELLRKQRLGLHNFQVGSDQGDIRLPFLGHEDVVALARRPEDRQPEADCALALEVVLRVGKFERLDPRGSRTLDGTARNEVKF